MVEAKLGTPERFWFLPDVQLLTSGQVTLDVRDDGGVRIPGSPFATTAITVPASLATIGIHRTAPIAFPKIGDFYFVWEGPGFKSAGKLSVTNTPTSEVATGVPHRPRYPSPGLVTVTDLVLNIHDGESVLVSTHTTVASQIPGIYETSAPITITKAGTYLYVWTSVIKGYTFTRIETIRVLQASDLRTLSVWVIDTSVDPQLPQPGVDVLLSKTDGTPLQQSRTDQNGKAQLSARNGKYVASARKAGVTWSKNNLQIEATDPSSGPNANKFWLFATPFATTFDPSPPFAASATSLMTVDMADMHGNAVAFSTILISDPSSPIPKVGQNGKNYAIFGEPILLKTDGNGHAETLLLRGRSVVVAFEASSVRRTIVVPDVASFDLTTLLAAQPDPFEIVTPRIAAAVRAS